MHGQFFGGYWQISPRAICLNEGGYICGLTVSFKARFFDAWFKFPRRGARSCRVSRLSNGRWCVGRV
jgi:hypothetical protein